MVSFEEAEEIYNKKYKNKKVQFDLNTNKNLKIDFKKFCQELSRKGKSISSSKRVCILMVRDMEENKDRLSFTS